MKIILVILTPFLINSASYAMVKETSLELGAIYEKGGEWDKAIENYKSFLIKNFNHPDSLILGTFKLGRALMVIGKEKEGNEKLKEVSTLYNRYKNLIDPFYAEYIANAKFILNEPLFTTATSPYKNKNVALDNFIKTREEALNLIKAGYYEIIKLHVKEWTMASLYKIGLAYEITGNAILNAPLPEESTNIKREEFYLNLRNKGLPFEDRATTFYKEVIDLNKKLDTGKALAQLAAQRLENLK